jgi:hypothetical protein
MRTFVGPRRGHCEVKGRKRRGRRQAEERTSPGKEERKSPVRGEEVLRSRFGVAPESQVNEAERREQGLRMQRMNCCKLRYKKDFGCFKSSPQS